MTKQATLPEGASSLGLAGTAPGLVARRPALRRRRAARPAGRAAAALAGALETRAACGACSRGTSRPGRRVLRFYGVERVGGRAGARGGRAATATGSRRRSARATSRSTSTSSSSRAPRRARTSSTARFREPLERYLFAEDERPVAGDRARALPRARAARSATAESCTGGLVAARLTDVARLERRLRGRRSSRTRTRSRTAELGVPADAARRARRRLGGGGRGDGGRRARAARRRRRASP